MIDKIKKSLPKFPKHVKDLFKDDTVAGYQAFEELHQLIEESFIGG